MDECDIAQELNEKYLNGAIWAARVGATPSPRPSPNGRGGTYFLGGEGKCIDCGMEIPEARRAAVPECVRCVGCQGKKERLKAVDY